MAPPSDGGPSEAESQNRRIPPTPVCRDEVGLTSWLGKPLHLPARREQVWVLRLTLEFRMLPCLRGCRLTGLVTSRISRSVGGKEPPGEKEAKMILQDAGRDKGGWSVAEGPRHQLAVSFWIRVLVGLFGLMLSSSGSEGGCEWITGINLVIHPSSISPPSGGGVRR
jgi:hypothetical protein